MSLKTYFILSLTIFFATFALGNVPYDKKILYDFSPIQKFIGDHLKQIAFPIGGIGTGNITLGGRGDLRDWEIFNRPGKGKQPNLTFFAIWARPVGGSAVVKILERKLLPPYTGWMGIPRQTLSGIQRFDEIEFKGEYPFAWLNFQDRQIPVEVKLEAYNPMIPLDPDNSGIPVAIFNWIVSNPLNDQVEVAICFSMQNPIGTDGKDFGGNLVKNGVNEFVNNAKIQGLNFSSNYLQPDDVKFGTIAMMTTEQDVNVQTSWYRGGWWDNAHIFWDDFSDDGKINDKRERIVSPENNSDVASIIVKIKLEPNETRTIPFYLTWHFPQRENYWNSEPEVRNKKMKNYYATKFKNAMDVADYVVENLTYLETNSRLFHKSLFGSTLPNYVIDAVSSQASILKTNTVLRIEDGQFFGFEGLTDDGGCCWMNCTHVWNYAQTAAFLFPSLERSARETDFLYNTFDNGYMPFRSLIPLGDYRWQFKPCADGQMGAIIRAYREWKFSGDNEWLEKIWRKVKKSLEFAWTGVGKVSKDLEWQKEKLLLPWDGNKDGVMEGEQHNTYDIEFYGPNTMTGSIYLAALKAAAEMAAAVGDKKASNEYKNLFEQGSKKYDQLLWNGKYYFQDILVEKGLRVPENLKSPTDESCCDSTCKCKSSPGGKKEALAGSDIPKYQYGKGCLSDQLLGQFEAYVTGLGYVMNPSHVNQALKSIFENNFNPNLGSFSNVQRVYALNDEAGLLLCSWPVGERPRLPFVYSDEVWTGIEYQVAASLIYAGWIDEGLTIVKAVRDRHDGLRRNPWDEFECGHHYARAMASWAVLLALSGFLYDGVEQTMSFSPTIKSDDFQVFWSCGTGWGDFSMNPENVKLNVLFGEITLKNFHFSHEKKQKIEAILVDGKLVEYKSVFDKGHYTIQFEKPLMTKKDAGIMIKFYK